MQENKSSKLPYMIGFAAIMWFVMFSPWTKTHVNFWLVMAISGSLLVIFSVLAGNHFWKMLQFRWLDVGIGVASAAFMWVVFWIGNFLATHWFHFAAPQVSQIYGLKGGNSPILIALLLLFIIGPAEEIFWRGYVMERLSEKWGPVLGFITAVGFYTVIHIWAFNFMLFMAALICGVFWGLLWKWNKHLLTIIISHALWDALVFVIFPI